MPTLISALFDSNTAAEQGVRALVTSGFTRDRILKLGSEDALSREIETARNRRPTFIVAGTVTGALAGAVGASLSLIVIPGMDTAGAGLLMTAIGAGIGTVLGAFGSTLLSAATELQETGQKDRAVDEGKLIVGVQAEQAEIEKVRAALLSAGGRSEAGEAGTLSPQQPLNRPIE